VFTLDVGSQKVPSLNDLGTAQCSMAIESDRNPAPDLPEQAGLQPVLGLRLAQAQLATRAIFFQEAGEPLNLRPVEFAVLSLVAAHPDTPQTRLARALSVTPPNMTGIINRMEARGWIERTSSTEDRRSQMLKLTRSGAALLRESTQRIAAAEKAQLRLSPGEQAMLLELLEKVARSVA
jgi:DNA-binding MarR family transcriptional regulator